MFKLKSWVFLFAALFISHSLYALTTLTVTKSTDHDPGGLGEVGDLRYVLNTMNQDLQTTTDDYAIVFATPMTIHLNGILPIINNSSNPVNITIGNSGSTPTVTIDGDGIYSGFFIPIGNVTIQNMIFQNLIAKGGNGGSGIAAGGGGMGAGGAIYVPQNFLNLSSPSITLMNVSISHCSAEGGNGGSYFDLSATGNEGGGGGGGFSGNGGSITIPGITGGAGGGGFGGNGGDVVSTSGGGGGGGGFGSRATLGTLTNLGDGGSDQSVGLDGNGYGLNVTAGSGAGGNSGGAHAGGGGGGAGTPSGGGGGGSNGAHGLVPNGNTPPLSMNGQLVRGKPQGNAPKLAVDCNIKPASKCKPKKISPMNDAASSGGSGGDGAGSGGAAVVIADPSNEVDGKAGSAGYGGGGGGGAGTGAYDTDYTVKGGSGGLGGGGGGGGVNQSGQTSADGGDSLGGGGGGGGGPSNGTSATGGSDTGKLGGGAGGSGADSYGSGSGGGGGGGGSGLGGAIFVDSELNFTIQALTGIPTIFNTSNNTVQAGTHGTAGPGGATDGLDGSALGDSIFLRARSSLTLMAHDADDLLTLDEGVSFVDDTTFGGDGTSVFVKGNGTVIYNGRSDYQGSITVNNANFKVNGEIDNAPVSVCRNSSFSSQRGTLSGSGTLTGGVSVNSGTISPDTGETINLGSLILNSAGSGALGSLVHIDIDSGGSSLVNVAGSSSLAGTLEINLESGAVPGQYTLLTSAGGITGTFNSVTFTGETPHYTLSYLPVGAPTYVEFNFLGYSSVDIPATLNGSPITSPAVVCCGRPIILGSLPVPGSGPTTYTVTHQTGNVTCQIGHTQSQTYLRVQGPNGSCTISGTKDGVTSNPFTVSVS